MDKIIVSLNLRGSEIYIQILSALIITIIAVLGIMIVSKWEFKKEENKK